MLASSLSRPVAASRMAVATSASGRTSVAPLLGARASTWCAGAVSTSTTAPKPSRSVLCRVAQEPKADKKVSGKEDPSDPRAPESGDIPA